jgi:ABC-type transport system involved in multi-copper enzyme maturation permease subunit
MKKINAIAINTLRESLRGKILYATLFFALLVVAASALFSSVTIGDHVKIVKDFGLFALSSFTILYAVISGGTLLYKELEKKTIYNILSKSVSRSDFIFGKFCGMLFTALILLLVMAVALVAFCFLLEGRVDPALLQAFPFIALQVFIICAVTIFFSAITVTPLLSGTFSFVVFFVGRSAGYLKLFMDSHRPDFVPEELIVFIYWILPQLDRIDISNQSVYGHIVDLEHVLYSGLYSLGYSMVVLMISVIIFSRREFN